MILFFDRDVGIRFPKALLELRFPTPVEYHQKYFEIDAKDDAWMPSVGNRGWILVGHDSKHHLEPVELSALKQYRMGCFYLWGSKAKRWEKMLCFLRAYQAILKADESTPRPYIYRVSQTGRLNSVSFP